MGDNILPLVDRKAPVMSRVRSRIGRDKDKEGEGAVEGGQFGKNLGREIASMAKEDDREVLEGAVNSTAMGIVEGMSDELDVPQGELNEVYIQQVIEMFDVEEDDLIGTPPAAQMSDLEEAVIEEEESTDQYREDTDNYKTEEDTEDEEEDTDQEDSDEDE